MGRPRRPTYLKVLAGDRESRINRGEPLPAEDDITPPDFLGDGALEVWHRLAPDLQDKGCLSSWDVDLFAAYCDAAATYREVGAIIGSAYTQKGSVKDTTVKAPLWRIVLDCIEVMNKIGGKFGLTPSDRAGIDVTTVDKKPTTGPERLLS